MSEPDWKLEVMADAVLQIFEIMYERPDGCDGAAAWITDFISGANDECKIDGEECFVSYNGCQYKFPLLELYELEEDGDFEEIILAQNRRISAISRASIMIECNKFFKEDSK